MKLTAAEADTERARRELRHAQTFLEQMQQMKDFCAYPKRAPAPPPEASRRQTAYDGISDPEDGESAAGEDPYAEDMLDEEPGRAAPGPGMGATPAPARSAAGVAERQGRMAKLEDQVAKLSEAVFAALAAQKTEQPQAPAPEQQPSQKASASQSDTRAGGQGAAKGGKGSKDSPHWNAVKEAKLEAAKTAAAAAAAAKAAERVAAQAEAAAGQQRLAFSQAKEGGTQAPAGAGGEAVPATPRAAGPGAVDVESDRSRSPVGRAAAGQEAKGAAPAAE